ADIQQLGVLEAQQLEIVSDVVLSPDGSMAAFRDRDTDNAVEIWDLSTFSLKHVLIPENIIDIWDMEFSSDGTVLAIQQSHFIQVWDMDTGDMLFLIEVAEPFFVNLMQITPTSDLLAYVIG